MRWSESPDPAARSRCPHPARARAALRSGRATKRAGRLAVLLLPALASASIACGPRYARLTIHDRDGLNVLLRAETREGKSVDRGFAHPVTISPSRVTNILSRIDVRLEGKKKPTRQPAIPAELLFELGERIATALAQADSSQEVVVRAVRKERHLGIFTQKYLTSFVVYASGDDLFVHLSRVDYPMGKDREDEVPEPWPNRKAMDFKVLRGDGIVPVAAQAVAAAWRDPRFRSPGRVRVGPGGKVIRREILLDSPPEETDAPAR
jgi:hypothetical protein